MNVETQVEEVQLESETLLHANEDLMPGNTDEERPTVQKRVVSRNNTLQSREYPEPLVVDYDNYDLPAISSPPGVLPLPDYYVCDPSEGRGVTIYLW